MRDHRPRLLLATALLGLVAACGGGGGESGSSADCSLDGCTVTFARADVPGGTAEVSVLGVQARLVGVQDGTVDLEVAGQQVSVPVGTTTQVQGFTVGVESVDESAVVVGVTR